MVEAAARSNLIQFQTHLTHRVCSDFVALISLAYVPSNSMLLDKPLTPYSSYAPVLENTISPLSPHDLAAQRCLGLTFQFEYLSASHDSQ